MNQYDTTLKLLLKSSGRLMRALAGAPVVKWLKTELPKVQNLEVDLLGETAEGRLIQIELQSTNDAKMPLRMLEYKTGILRELGRFARQIVLYVGDEPLRMKSEVGDEDLRFRYRTVDIRSLDGDDFLASDDLADNVIAILARLRDHKEAVRKLVGRIASLPSAERKDALVRLHILAGLRRQLENDIRQEVREMPITLDIHDNPFLGPLIKEYEEKAAREAAQRAELRAELNILRRLIEKRFGAVPAWAEQQLCEKSTAELEELSLRLLDATTLEELLPANNTPHL